MATTVSTLIESCRAYANDENVNDYGWIPDSTWLRWLNVEYEEIYRDILRLSLRPPALSSEDITANSSTSYTLTATPLAIVDVAEVNGDIRRPLRAEQGDLGAYAYQRSTVSASATRYSVFGNGFGTTIQLYPNPSSGTYRVRYVPKSATLVTGTPAAGEASSVDLPRVVEDRICLGVARRALMKEQTSSRQLDRHIEGADEKISMHYSNSFQGAAIRRETPRVRSLLDSPESFNPYNWWWI